MWVAKDGLTWISWFCWDRAQVFAASEALHVVKRGPLDVADVAEPQGLLLFFLFAFECIVLCPCFRAVVVVWRLAFSSIAFQHRGGLNPYGSTIKTEPGPPLFDIQVAGPTGLCVGGALVFLLVLFLVELAPLEFGPTQDHFGLEGDRVEIGVFVFQAHGTVCCEF